jgi:hypothetical protein
MGYISRRQRNFSENNEATEFSYKKYKNKKISLIAGQDMPKTCLRAQEIVRES